MIREISGDILLSECTGLVHSIAPLDHFDSGLALGLREKYPEMVKGFRQYCHTHHPQTGEIWVWKSQDGRIIYNLLTQEAAPERSGGHPGKSSISNVEKSLKKLSKYIDDHPVDTIALPRIATGVGGLEWDDVRAAVLKHLGNTNTRIFIYDKYTKGQKGVEV
jgi:O-acetyl-ADP-ribose deacetylase (regulator of RNase III)